VGGPAGTGLIHLVKLPGKLQVDTGGVAAEISADGLRLGRVPGTVDVPPGDRTLTLKAPRYLDHVERSPSRAAASGRNSKSRSSRRSVWSA
jgi:hypothetical protein